jgi:hypothetical protein
MGSDYMAPSKRAGLGVGLALGFAVIIGAAIAWFWYSRRLRRRREAREKELRELALGAQRFHSSALGLGGIESRGGERVLWTGWVSSSVSLETVILGRPADYPKRWFWRRTWLEE